MLICKSCGKIIANVAEQINYAICANCPIPEEDYTGFKEKKEKKDAKKQTS